MPLHLPPAGLGVAVAVVVGVLVLGAGRPGEGRPRGGRATGPRAPRGPRATWGAGLPLRDPVPPLRAPAGAGRSPLRAAGRQPDRRGARWAGRRDLGPLVVGRVRLGPGRGARAGKAAPPGRLVLGALAGPGGRPRRTLLAAEVAQSVAVVGPTQSGKTSALAVPAILAWEGPVVAASVKTDLLRDTIGWRRRQGQVWCFDPGRATGLPASEWSPLRAAATWGGARRVAADLTEVAQSTTTTPDGEFWYATAAKLLAPLLFAAASAGLQMRDVVRWVDTQEVAEVADILEGCGVPDALQAARATWQRDDRQRSSVYTTAETVLEPFAVALAAAVRPAAGGRGAAADTPPYGTPAVGRGRGARDGRGSRPIGTGLPSGPAAGDSPGEVDPGALLDGANTLYLCAPAHDQRRLRGLFTAVVKQVLEAAFARSARLGGPLSPPLLVVLDEAANIAPLAELDGLAATCAGHGVQLVTVWQDLAQMAARYGERADTVINNHRAKLFFSGIADPRTLDHASHLVGDEEATATTVSRDPAGGRTVAGALDRRPLLPPEALRRLRPGTGVLVYGSLSPVRLALQPWFRRPELVARVQAGEGSKPPRPGVTAGVPSMGMAGSTYRRSLPSGEAAVGAQAGGEHRWVGGCYSARR